MAAETLTNTFLPMGATHGLAKNLKVHYLTASIASAAIEDGDIWVMGYMPPNSMVVGGWMATTDLDTGTEALDIDVGWAAAGASDTYTDPENGLTYTNAAASADPDGLCNVGVMTGDGVSEVYNAGKNFRWLTFEKPLFFSAKTTIQIEANAAAGTQAAGTFGVYLLYYAL